MEWSFGEASGLITSVVAIGGGIVVIIRKAIKTVSEVQNIGVQVDKLDDRIDKLDVRIDKLESRIDKLESRLDQRIDKLENKVDQILFLVSHKLKRRRRR